MKRWRSAGIWVVLCLLAVADATFAAASARAQQADAVPPAPAKAGAPDAPLFRVFLTDGTSLVSYGEPARVDDRAVFSMPTSVAPSAAGPDLHLVNIAADRVDWTRTTRYAESARAAMYLKGQAAYDYAILSNEVARALNDISTTTDSAARLATVEKARKMLAAWPASHFNYKLAEVQQMLGMLDETIVNMRASANGSIEFDLSLVTGSTPPGPPPPSEPILPQPTEQDLIQQELKVAKLTESSAERSTLLAAALDRLERSAKELPAAWAGATVVATRSAIALEKRTDRSYDMLTRQMLTLAKQRARLADVRGLQRLVVQIHARDEALGARRPESVNALVDSVEESLDAARRLRLARDQWELRAAAYRKYRVSIGLSLTRFTLIKPSLEGIKALAGSGPAALGSIQRVSAQILRSVSTISPPEELSATHALLVSAAQLASSAADIRREAALAGDMARAWDASAAAAGSLMLTDRAKSEIQNLTRFPQLPR